MAFTAKFDFFGKSDVGLKRTINEDAFTTRPDLYFCVAADGMGGAAAGELASRIFVESASKTFEAMNGRSETDTVELIKKAFFFRKQGNPQPCRKISRT